jgi:hypothetical protein
MFHRPYAFVLNPRVNTIFNILWDIKERMEQHHTPFFRDMSHTFLTVATYLAIHDKVSFFSKINNNEDYSRIERDILILEAIYYLGPEKIVSFIYEAEKYPAIITTQVCYLLISEAIKNNKERSMFWDKTLPQYDHEEEEEYYPTLPEIIMPIVDTAIFLQTFRELLVYYKLSFLKESANSFIEQLASVALDLPQLAVPMHEWPDTKQILSFLHLTEEEFISRCKKDEEKAIKNGSYPPFLPVSPETIYKILKWENDREFSYLYNNTQKYIKLASRHNSVKNWMLNELFGEIHDDKKKEILKFMMMEDKENADLDARINASLLTYDKAELLMLFIRNISRANLEVIKKVYSMILEAK